MPIHAECPPCLKRLVRQLAELSSDRPEVQADIVRRGDALVDEAGCRDDLEPTHVSTRFFRMAKKRSGNPDPFGPRKAHELRLARAALARAEVPPRSDLAGRLRLAVAGNAIDFFRPFAQVERDLRRLPPFAVDHLPRLEAALNRRSGPLLYLADNAGEVVFDLPLIEALLARGADVRLVVKGAPSQNDLTAQDLAAVGPLPPGLQVVENGTDAVGTQLAEVSAEMRRLIANAGLLLAKGMANFESLRAERRLPPTFFCFIAKCVPNARMAGVAVERRVVLEKE